VLNEKQKRLFEKQKGVPGRKKGRPGRKKKADYTVHGRNLRFTLVMRNE
jgi:hypothetical protein